MLGHDNHGRDGRVCRVVLVGDSNRDIRGSTGKCTLANRCSDHTRNRVNLYIFPPQVTRRCNIVRICRIRDDGETGFRSIVQARTIHLALSRLARPASDRRVNRVIRTRVGVNDREFCRNSSGGTIWVGYFYRNGDSRSVLHSHIRDCGNRALLVDGELPVRRQVIRQLVLSKLRIRQLRIDIRRHLLPCLSHLRRVRREVLASTVTNNVNGAGHHLRGSASGIVSLHRHSQSCARQSRLRNRRTQLTGFLVDGDGPITELVLQGTVGEGITVGFLIVGAATQADFRQDRLKFDRLAYLPRNSSVVRYLDRIDNLERNLNRIGRPIGVGSDNPRQNLGVVRGSFRRGCFDFHGSVIIDGCLPPFRNRRRVNLQGLGSDWVISLKAGL